MAVLISGIGRSGTTTVYQILGKGLINKLKQVKCVYEPYLWNIPEIENTAVVKGQPFSVEQVGLFNIYVHCNTPIFLQGRHALHDQWLRKVFGPLSPAAEIAPENTMAKVIRGAGRLEAALTKYSNLKVVVITRNIVDTANSGLGLFSFFGDEFHPSDKSRFLAEVNQKFSTSFHESQFISELEWSVFWWHYLTEASIQTYEKYPNRVLLVPYEHYVRDKPAVMGDIFDFCGLEREFIDKSLFEQGAGPSTSVSYLNKNDLARLRPEMKWYFNRLTSALNIDLGAESFIHNQAAKYSSRKYSKSLLLSDPTNLTAVQWRIQKRNLLTESAAEKDRHFSMQPFSVSAVQAECGTNDICKSRNQPGAKFEDNDRIGVLITSFNNESTIAESIYSVLNQTRKPDLICVADDASTDRTVQIVSKLKEKFPTIQLIKRPMNVGVSANRDLAIKAMEADFIATLDGDDLYYPEKLELELLAIQGDKNKVAFSDIAVVVQDRSMVQDTRAYSCMPVAEMLRKLTSRSTPVPRDMLFSRALFLKAEGFDVGMSIYEDWAFKMRLMGAAGDGNWVHSSGKGTIYDRRHPGLSGRPPIEHAYGQLLALARNSKLLSDFPESIELGLRTVAKHLDGGMLVRMSRMIDSLADEKMTNSLSGKLADFWENATFRNDSNYKYRQIWKFSALA
ncbi:MAG: glycosyltransferase [Chromatiaceae bacterium]|nr:glycosyltransferase [Chromatiaceae bacterium]